MKTLRLGQNTAYDFNITSKKKDLTVNGHKVIFAARAPALLNLFHEQGDNSVDLSKKLTQSLVEWIYEDDITGIQKYTYKQLETLLLYAIQYELTGLVDLIEHEVMQRLDPDMIMELDYSVITTRIANM